jgi:hypothetical protein
MQTIGYNYKIIGSTQHGNFYENELKDYYYLSNAIYSKIKLENEEIYSFSYLNRNVLTATIKFNNKIIRIFNTHLEYFDTKNLILINSGNNENHLVKRSKKYLKIFL